MIEKIRKRFIFISMTSVSVVLLMILSLINIINYSNTEHKINHEIENFFNVPNKPMNNKFKNFDEKNIRVSYAIIENNEIVTNKLFKVEDIEIINITDKMKKNNGYIDDYYYTKIDNMIYIFDFHIEKSSFRTFLYTCSTVILSSILLIYLMILLVSDKALEPFSKNYYKQKQFITNVSHDLKTPLAIIMTNSEVIEMEYGNNEWNESIKKQSIKISKMIDDMILLSRVEEEINEIYLKDINVFTVINEIVNEYTELAKKNKQKINVSGNDFYIKADNQSFNKMITLLLDNAIKYAKHNSNINININNKKLIINNEVDNFIEKEELSQLFDRFYRVDASRNSDIKGSGIGLAIVDGIIKNHNWKVKAYMNNNNLFTIEVNF